VKDASTLSNCARGAMNNRRQQIGGRNVFNDLGKPKADEHRIKAKLVFKIDTILKERGLKQVEAAGLIGIRQPDVSKMLRGEFRQFSGGAPSSLPRGARSGCRDRRQTASWRGKRTSPAGPLNIRVKGPFTAAQDPPPSQIQDLRGAVKAAFAASTRK